MSVDLWVWPAFVGLILFLLALDLFVFRRDAHEVSFREATFFSVFWVTLGLAFGGLIPIWISLTVIATMILVSIVASLRRTGTEPQEPEEVPVELETAVR